MTNLKDIPETQTQQTKATNGKTELPEAEHQEQVTPKPKESLAQSSIWKKSKGSTLQNRLLLGILPAVLVPLGVAGTAGWWLIHEQLEEQYRTRLEEQTLIAGEDMNEWLAARTATSETLAKNPLVIEGVNQGSEQVIRENLNTLDTRELEQRFSETKRLLADDTLGNYLKGMAQANNFGEIIVTEKHGLNIAYNQITSDFVQKGEPWWDTGKTQGQFVGELQYDDSSGTRAFSLVQPIQDPDSNDFLGVIKIGVPTSSLESVEKSLGHSGILPTGNVQILNTSNNEVFIGVTQGGKTVGATTQGGEAVETFAATMVENQGASDSSVQENLGAIAQAYNLKNFVIQRHSHGEGTEADNEHESGEKILQASFYHEGRSYQLATIPGTDWVTISSVDETVLQSAGNELIQVFVVAGLVLGTVAVGIAFLLARQLSSPLINVSQAARKAARGDLSVRAQPQGTEETQTLANSFNNLVERVQELLQNQEATTEQQRKQREALEEEVSRLMTDIEQAADGDLTVRAQLMEGDIGIVADLFNAVIENLQETAQQVKTAASQVSESLGENEIEIRNLAAGAVSEAEEIQRTLASVEEMNRSIQEVTQNAQKAASIADTAFSTAQAGNQAMDETVESIQALRSTVGETSKKMKQMGESAQKISQVVSLIDEISLKTSLLAINASVEANRAGELGQGFTSVAEQVEALAEQSASAATEIAEIVATIQNETQDAIKTMEQGTSEVVASTRSVEETKARLTEVVQRSEEINNLMRSISDSTVSQAETSQAVSRLMEQVTQSSQERSHTSGKVAEAIQETAQVAKQLEASVEQFRVQK